MSRLPFTFTPSDAHAQRFDVIGVALGLAYLIVAFAVGLVLAAWILG
jgi:hypothetical protein